jgi:hypothetical protein
VLAEIAHDMRNPLAPLQNAVHIMRLSDLGSDKERVDWLVDVMNRMITRIVRYVDYLGTLVRYPNYRADIRLDELPRFHEELNAALRVEWPTDTSELANGAGRKIIGEYFRFMSVVAHAVLLTVRQLSQTSVRVVYRVEPDRLVGRADVADAAEVDPDGWNLVRLAAAVYNVPVSAETAAGTLTLRWEVPLC